jgi:hypothetical protein
MAVESRQIDEAIKLLSFLPLSRKKYGKVFLVEQDTGLS